MEDGISPPPPGVEKVAARLHGSTIGQKALMAVSGLLLLGFSFAHMAGHLQMFAGAEKYNAYAHMLQSLGGIKWAVRFGLLGMVFLHIFSATQVTLRNRAARPIAYAQTKWLAASLGARTMRVSGGIVLFFILYHLLHFTVLLVGTAGFPEEDTFKLANDVMVDDVYRRMVVSFQNPILAIFYVVSVGLLCLHLSHGIQSALQTLGALNSTYRPFFKKLGPALSGLLFIGFASVPLAILAGVIH
jgi:succinate dehydrogenase / fumarate reductase cytochrome b subunit